MNKIFLGCFLLVALAGCQQEDSVPGQDDRYPFLGTWNMDSHGTVSGHLTYTMDVVPENSNPSQIIMKNFDSQGTSTSVIAEVDGFSLSILNNPRQVVGSDTIAGTGNYNNQQLTFSYTVKDGIYTDVVTATGTR